MKVSFYLNSRTSSYIYKHPFITRQIKEKSLKSIGSRISGQKLYQTRSNMSLAKNFYDFKPLDKAGQPVDLTQYKGKAVLVVNTASKCGFTPQFQGLEKLYKSVNTSHPDSFVILGFPCNQFGSQDPGTNEEIQNFCKLNYNTSFPILGKVNVNGDNAEPLFEWLKSEKPGLLGLKRVKWNFEKWLVSKDGKPVERWASTAQPESLEKSILKEINE